jgi:hypothetical protein
MPGARHSNGERAVEQRRRVLLDIVLGPQRFQMLGDIWAATSTRLSRS